MNKNVRTLLPALAALLVLTNANGLRAQGTKLPARDTLRDATTDMIRSDGLGPYVNGTDCVLTYVDPNSGFFFLRTVYNCTTAIRSITLDFSRPTSGHCPATRCVTNPCGQTGNQSICAPDQIDICGPNTLPDVRIIANTLFRKNALTLGTSVSLPFNLGPSFNCQAFNVSFEQNLLVTLDANKDANVRILTAGPSAVADLSLTGSNPKTPSKLGSYFMPFQLTVTEQ